MPNNKKTYKIGIYETQAHQTFLHYLILLCEPGKNEIHLFVSDKIFKLLKELDENIENKVIVHINKRKNKFHFNRFVSSYSRKLDIFIANTLMGGRMALLSYLFFNPKCRFVLVDALYGDYFHRKINKYNWDVLSNFYAYWITGRMIKKADVLLYHSLKILKEVEKYTNKSLFYLPFTFYTDRYPKTNISDKIIFTITGAIQKIRKNYTVFFKALEILLNDSPEIVDKIQIIFLGTVKKYDKDFGDEIIAKAEMFNKKYGHIIQLYKEEYIAEKTYREIISETDIFINPVNLNYYKIGTITSGLTEAITYSIPLIYPYGYSIADELKTSTIYYSNENELKNIIYKITYQKDYFENLKIEAKQNSSKYSFQKYRELFQKNIIIF